MAVAIQMMSFHEEPASTIENEMDAALARWAALTRGGASWLGIPKRSVTEAAREGGVRGTRPPTALPEDVAATDRAVAQLKQRHDSILSAVIELRYEKALPIEGVAIALHLRRRKAENLLKRAQRAVWALQCLK